MTADDPELAYLAGFFDGEGSISIMRRRGTAFVALTATQVDLRPLRLMQVRWGGNIQSHPPGVRGRWPFHQWQISARQAKRPLQEMLPYLVVKAGQARLALLFQGLLRTRGVFGVPLTEVEMAERLSFVEAFRDLRAP